jgi:NitT/TauT family transport system ATP-binding protein
MKLKCSQISVTYRSNGSGVRAIEDISFQLEHGEFLAVVGPSGCGKTTLLRVLAGLLKPDRGTVTAEAHHAGETNRALLVFQENNLFPWMTVLENAVFGLEMQGVGSRERESRALAVLHRFGLRGRERAYPHQLSVGMKQRVAVIRSFLCEPAVLLMDEHFSALDVQTRLELQQELLALWEQQQRQTVVFVTHDVGEALLLGDRILLLSPQPSTVAAEFVAPFPRPRKAAIVWDAEFLRLKRLISEELGAAPQCASGRWAQ